MMLRASTRHRDYEADLRAIGHAGVDSGVPNSAVLTEFSEALLGTDPARLARARTALVNAMGEAALSDVAAVAGNFQMMDRIANGCGIALDSVYEKATRRYRDQLGMDDFPSKANTPGA